MLRRALKCGCIFPSVIVTAQQAARARFSGVYLANSSSYHREKITTADIPSVLNASKWDESQKFIAPMLNTSKQLREEKYFKNKRVDTKET